MRKDVVVERVHDHPDVRGESTVDRVEGAGVSGRSAWSGQWIGVAGESVTLILPAEERARAVALWPIIDDGAGLVAVLDALLVDGLSSLDGFVLVETDGDRARVLVRGEAVVTAHTLAGQVRVSASGRLWAEDSFAGLVALVAELPGEVAGDPLERTVLRPGLTRLGGLTWGRVPEQPSARVPTPEVPPARTAPPVPPAPVAPPAPPASEEERLETVPLSAVPLAPEWQEEVTDHLPLEQGGLSVLGFGVPHEEPSDVPAPTHRTVAMLVFNHGATLPVDGPLLIGRGPTARVGSPGARLVTVPSPHQEVSGTHVEIRPGEGVDLGTAVVTDLGSTNGTVVAQPGLSSVELRPGSPVSLLPGAVIDLGDGVTIEVRRP